MAASLASQLKPLALFGGLSAQDLFASNNLVMIAWALLVFAPRWKWTPSITLASTILHSIIFMGTATSTMMADEPSPDVDFSSLEGVHGMMSDPTNSFAIWLHMVIFDLIVVRMMVLDSVDRGASTLFHCAAMVPCILLTFVMGPVGFVLYLGLRQVFLMSKSNPSGKDKIL